MNKEHTVELIPVTAYEWMCPLCRWINQEFKNKILVVKCECCEEKFEVSKNE